MALRIVVLGEFRTRTQFERFLAGDPDPLREGEDDVDEAEMRPQRSPQPQDGAEERRH